VSQATQGSVFDAQSRFGQSRNWRASGVINVDVHAADIGLPAKAPAFKAAPVAPPPYNWSGCHVGGQVDLFRRGSSTVTPTSGA
jgi:hypothetical protein